jgi:uroporphyrin-III C-methyltransferase
MGIGTLPHVVQGLQRFGAAADLPVAIIERGFSDSQKTTITSLGATVQDAALAGVNSPAVIVIGEVVRLAHHGDDDASAQLARAQRLATLE